MKISEIFKNNVFKNNVKEAELLEIQNPFVKDRVTRSVDKKALEEVANRDPAMEQLTSEFGVVPAKKSQLRTILDRVNKETPLRTLDSDEDVAREAVIERSPRSIIDIVTPDEITAINSCSCDRVMNAVPSENLLQSIRNTPAAHFDSGAKTQVTGPNGTFATDYTEEDLKKAHEKAGTEYDRKKYPTRSELVHRHILNTLDEAGKGLQTNPNDTGCKRIIHEFMNGSSSLAGVPSEGGTKQLNHNFVAHYLSHVRKAGLEPSDVGITPEELERFKFASEFLTGKAKEQAATRAEQPALPSPGYAEDEEAYRDTRLEKPGNCKTCEQYQQSYNDKLLKLKDNISQRILGSGKPYSPEYADSTAAELAHHVHNLWSGKTTNDSLENELFTHHAKEIEGMHDVLADWDDHRDNDHQGATEQAIHLDIPINYSKPGPKQNKIIDADTGEEYEPDIERNPDVDDIYKKLQGVTDRWDLRARTDIHMGEDPFLDEEGRPVTQMRGESDESFAIRRQKKVNEARLDINIGVRPSTLKPSPSIRKRPDYEVIETQSEPKTRVNVQMPGRNVEGYIEGVDENGNPIPLKNRSFKTSVPNRTERVWTYSADPSYRPGSTVVVAPMENFRTDKCRHHECENPETCNGNHDVTYKVPYLPDTNEVKSLQQQTPTIAGPGIDEQDDDETIKEKMRDFSERKTEWSKAEDNRYRALREHMQEKVGVSTQNFRSARCEKCGSQLCSGWHKADDQSIMSLPSEHAYLFQTAGMQPDLSKWRKYRDIQIRYMAQQPAEMETTTREVKVPRELSLNGEQKQTDFRELVDSADAAYHQKRFQEWHDGLDDYGKSLYDEYTKGYARSRAEIEAKLNEAYPWGTEDNPNPDNFANVQNLLKRWDKNWHRKFSREHTHRYFDFDDDKIITDTKMVPRSWDEVFADYPMKKGVVPTSGPLFKAMNGRGIPMPTEATMGTQTRLEEVSRAVRPTQRLKPPRLGLKLDAMNDYRRSFEAALGAVYPGVGREEAIERLKADHAEQVAKASTRKTSSIEEGNEMAKYIFNSGNKKEAMDAASLAHGAEHVVNWIGHQGKEIWDSMHHPFRQSDKFEHRWDVAYNNGTLGENGNPEYYSTDPMNEILHAAEGYGAAAVGAGYAVKKTINKVMDLKDRLNQRKDNKSELDRRKNIWDSAPDHARDELVEDYGRQANPYHPKHMDVHAPGSDGPWDRIAGVGVPKNI